MTEEEKAKEYIKNNCEQWEQDGLTVDEIAKVNYLAGLHEGQSQLTEAKEIIRELISWQILTQYWEAKKKAEAFINKE